MNISFEEYYGGSIIVKRFNIGNKKYKLCVEKGNGYTYTKRGFNGKLFVILFSNGTKIQTRNLWSEGDVDPNLENAKFLLSNGETTTNSLGFYKETHDECYGINLPLIDIPWYQTNLQQLRKKYKHLLDKNKKTQRNITEFF